MTSLLRDWETLMDAYYEIRVKGQLASHWSGWFAGMTISDQPNGEALLCGRLADQSVLHGVLVKIRDLGLPLLEVRTRATESAQCGEA